VQRNYKLLLKFIKGFPNVLLSEHWQCLLTPRRYTPVHHLMEASYEVSVSVFVRHHDKDESSTTRVERNLEVAAFAVPNVLQSEKKCLEPVGKTLGKSYVVIVKLHAGGG
jgi:hypothetical protein